MRESTYNKILDYHINVYNDNFHLKEMIGDIPLNNVITTWDSYGFIEGLSGISVVNTACAFNLAARLIKDRYRFKIITKDPSLMLTFPIIRRIISKLNDFYPPYLYTTTIKIIQDLDQTMDVEDWVGLIRDTPRGIDMERELVYHFTDKYQLPECK